MPFTHPFGLFQYRLLRSATTQRRSRHSTDNVLICWNGDYSERAKRKTILLTILMFQYISKCLDDFDSLKAIPSHSLLKTKI